MKLEKITYLEWEESERGWGIRPDGCSLHLTEKDAENFEREYWSRMPDEVPEEYSRPAGNPVNAYVSKKLYDKIKATKNGLRLWDYEEKKYVREKVLFMEVKEADGLV